MRRVVLAVVLLVNVCFSPGVWLHRRRRSRTDAAKQVVLVRA